VPSVVVADSKFTELTLLVLHDDTIKGVLCSVYLALERVVLLPHTGQRNVGDVDHLKGAMAHQFSHTHYYRLSLVGVYLERDSLLNRAEGVGEHMAQLQGNFVVIL
jgi:hypothetical protein